MQGFDRFKEQLANARRATLEAGADIPDILKKQEAALNRLFKVGGNAAKGGTTAFRSFTASNFRTNLGRLTGNVPANSQAHHIFPQKYANQFAERGINIHDPKFGAWWETTSHLKNASGYNEVWRQFFRTNPTQSQILDKGRQLMQQYGIPVNY